LREVNAPDHRDAPDSSRTICRQAGHACLQLGLILLVLSTAAAHAAQAAKCQLGRLPDIPVTMNELRPLVHAQINGSDALFIADSGAFFSSVQPEAVAALHLRVDPSIQGLFVEGVGGREHAQVARAKTFTLMNKTWENVDFVVVGSSFGGGAVGLLGQNVFRMADVEYDLANGVIRLVQPRDCSKNTPLAYWVADTHQPYSVIDIDSATLAYPHTKSVAYLNGARIYVMFDTGAGSSMLTLAAAKRAGVTPANDGVTAGGSSWGIGHRVSNTWIATFDSFKIGDEQILHARLRFGDISLTGADMLIGPDFFLSHRIYVASSQRKLYFTYNGGAVFDLRHAPSPETPDGGTRAASGIAGDDAGAPAATEPARADMNGRLDEPADAAGFARRGAAFAARHDYQAAIRDLTRACELAPREPGFFHERGMAYWHDQQADLALADFDQAIKLEPNDVDALMSRATLRARRHDPPEAISADLDAVDRVAPKEAAVRLALGGLYMDSRNYPAAIVQYGRWIDTHDGDFIRMPQVRNARCWARALAGLELDQALDDCNAAVRANPKTASFHDSRGLVYLRQGRYDKAIADYDAALAINPKIAWSLYGRGIAKQRLGQGAAGHADLAAATALAPKIAAEAASHGIAP
jgi:tetratricopeptide (TPR) repeat protein